ncbi:MAG: CpsD/CapB family tyrosine-protein kinase [Terriglobales bacterium]|jgi:capsular exopolysaccharide synthesis family protein
MSRNFELLQKAADEREHRGVASAVPEPSAPWVEPATSEEEATGSVPHSLEGVSREEMTKLVQRLFLLPDSSRMVVFSGVERGAGCTWLTAQVARSLAERGRNTVCVVDANLRFPAMHDVFGIANHNGLTDAIAASASLQGYLRKTPMANLWLLTCGSPEKTEQALNASDQMLSCIQQLRSHFDFVLIDSPPMNLFNDAVRLASVGDGIALVLKANTSRRETAQRVVREARAANVRVLGAVLNQRTFPVPESIYKRL